MTTYLYDDLNRLVGVVENDTGGAQTDSSNVLTQYQYDISGNRLVITNARSFTQTLTSYDVLGRPAVVTDTLGHETTYQYDALGRVRQMVDGNSALTTYAYDGLNRVISTTYHADNETILNTYNALGNRLAMSDATGITTYQYDDLNRPITVTSPLTGTVIYGYDLNGNRTSLTYPDDKVVTYTYDGDGRLTKVTDWNNLETTYAYDNIGRLITTTLSSGVVTTQTYDHANRLTSLQHTRNGQTLAQFVYTLDRVGNRLQAVETGADETAREIPGIPFLPTTIDYTYDDLHRLTDAVYTRQQGITSEILAIYDYTYDAVGNMTSRTEGAIATSQVFNSANQLVSKTEGTETTTYSYDGVGNLVESQVAATGGLRTLYTYNQRHLLLTQAQGTLSLPQLQAEFVYDGNGDRVQQRTKDNGQWVTTTYINDALGLTQVLLADDGTTTTANLFGLDLILQQENDGNPQSENVPLYLLTDGLGSVRIEMTGGEATATTSYAPYGEVLSQSGTSHTSYGYTGEQYDQTTGLLYLRARYYNPNLHQFMAKDPWVGTVSRPSSFNGYSYVVNSPVNFTDPTGLDPWYCDWIAFSYEVPSHGYDDAHKHCVEAYSTNNSVESSYDFGIVPPDGISAFALVTPSTQSVFTFDVWSGIEAVHNFNSGTQTVFAVLGFGGGISIGETADISFNLIYNLDDDNLNYKGNFIGINFSIAKVIGGTIGRAVAPDDINPFVENRYAYSTGLGCAFGVGFAISGAIVDYIPRIFPKIWGSSIGIFRIS